MDAAAHHLRDQLIGLCHLLSADRPESLPQQVCRLLMGAFDGERACLFLTDATGQSVDLAAATALGDSHWGAGARRLAIGPSAGSRCPLSQVAQTGRMLILTGGPQGYDLSRLCGLVDLPGPERSLIVLPMRGARDTRLMGLTAVQTPAPQAEPGPDLRLLVSALADLMAAQARGRQQAEALMAAQQRIERQSQAARAERAERAAGLETEFPGRSSTVRAMRDRLVQLASQMEPILLLGADGTGKERAARALHRLSPRRSGPFIYLDCSALPPLALISEMSGYKRGAVPGQAAARRGLLREAAGGTLYLDRLDGVGPEAQLFLARLLETRQFRALGSERDTPVTARLVFAARPDLPLLAEKGQFLPGLAFTLTRLVLRLPALSERPEDIADIVDAVLARQAAPGCSALSLNPSTLALLRVRQFPANQRQLETLIERAAELAEDGATSLAPVHIEAARQGLDASHAEAPELPEGLRDAVAKFEAELIARALAQTGGDRAKAAILLNIPKRTLADKCIRYAL